MKKKFGFLGGTFDPPHFGHINFSLEMKEKHQLDKILVCPAGVPPHKREKLPVASSLQRLDMAVLAFTGIEGIEVIDVEVKKKDPSYTIETIRLLREKYDQKKEEVELFLLLAEDAALALPSWKEGKELLEMTELLVGTRNVLNREELEAACTPEVLRKMEERKTTILEMGITSTLVRERLKKNLYCGHLVPTRVLDYINKNKIYSL